jgi:hypothetical protein
MKTPGGREAAKAAAIIAIVKMFLIVGAFLLN